MNNYNLQRGKRPGEVVAEFNGFNVFKIKGVKFSLQVGKLIRVRRWW